MFCIGHILQWCASQARLVGLREDFKGLRQWEENSDKYLSVHLIIQCITMLLLRGVKSRLFYFPFKEHFAKVILFSLLETGHGIRGKSPVQLYEKRTLLKLCIILLWLLVGPIQKKARNGYCMYFFAFTQFILCCTMYLGIEAEQEKRNKTQTVFILYFKKNSATTTCDLSFDC